MSTEQGQTLESNNLKIQQLIKANKCSDSSLKALLKKNKILIYSQEDITSLSDDFLRHARKFAQLQLLYALAVSAANNQSSNTAIESAIDNVKFFYENDLLVQRAEEFYMVTSIHLLYLLSQHKNEEFYTKIETLNNTPEDLKDKYISYVLLLNDAIEEGNYRRVFQLKSECPLVYFNSFLNRISETIRFEIAKSSEKAYTELSLSEALKLFQLSTEQQLKNFIEQYTTENSNQESDNASTNEQIQWRLFNQKIIFEKTNKRKVIFNSNDLILTTLSYAHELEKIA